MIMPTRSLLLASLLADADAARKAAPRKSALDIAADKAARGAEYIDPFIVMGTEKELQKRRHRSCARRPSLRAAKRAAATACIRRNADAAV